MKIFIIASNFCSYHARIQETTFRKACIKYLEKFHGLKNPKLFKVYETIGALDKHVGYGSGSVWLNGGELRGFSLWARETNAKLIIETILIVVTVAEILTMDAGVPVAFHATHVIHAKENNFEQEKRKICGNWNRWNPWGGMHPQ